MNKLTYVASAMLLTVLTLQ